MITFTFDSQSLSSVSWTIVCCYSNQRKLSSRHDSCGLSSKSLKKKNNVKSARRRTAKLDTAFATVLATRGLPKKRKAEPSSRPVDMEEERRFRELAESNGLIIKVVKLDGQIHRVPTEDAPKKKGGAYKFDGMSGWIQNWSRHPSPIMFRRYL